MGVSLGWDGYPTTTKCGEYVLPRKAEMILRSGYYPTGIVGEWPCCPKTGERLAIYEI